ncbi:hypothetical protein AB1L30_03460 [Bremerella sp. JC817]|uniref:hypothetical protein n=1 Tax=Bremerella sp. JC817 TaxID=3231756 RepID=UPI003459B0A3
MHSEEDASFVESPSPPLEAKGKRWQFSLSTIILLMALVAMAASQVLLIQRERSAHAKMMAARQEAEFYKTQMSEITIYDRNKIFARAIPNPEENQDRWQWRIFVPDTEQRYHLCFRKGDIPATGFPEYGGQGFIDLEPGESEVIVRIDRDVGDYGRVEVDVESTDPNREAITDDFPAKPRSSHRINRSNGLSMSIDEWSKPYVEGQGYAKTGGVVLSNGEVSWEAMEKAVLLRHRVSGPSKDGRLRLPEGPTQGLMLWIEPVSTD